MKLRTFNMKLWPAEWRRCVEIMNGW